MPFLLHCQLSQASCRSKTVHILAAPAISLGSAQPLCRQDLVSDVETETTVWVETDKSNKTDKCHAIVCTMLENTFTSFGMLQDIINMSPAMVLCFGGSDLENIGLKVNHLPPPTQVRGSCAAQWQQS